MSIAYDKRRKGGDRPNREQLAGPRSKRFKALQVIWRERKEARLETIKQSENQP